MKKKPAFTLVELLVVIAIIALLMSILVPALRLARDQAYRTVCSNQIKGIMLGMTLYAGDNNNKVITTGGAWPWDMDYTPCNKLLKYIGVDISNLKLPPNGDIPFQQIFYCPANVQQKRFKMNYWNFYRNPPETGRVVYRVLGYFFVIPAGWNGNGKTPIKGSNGQPDPAKSWVSRIDISQPANAEFITDAMLSGISPMTKRRTFAAVPCGGMPGQGSPDTSSHLISEEKPAGSNIGFVDNHVEWRNFNDLYVRFTPSWGCPDCWW